MSRSDARKPECDTLPFISVVYMQQQGVISNNLQTVLTTEWGLSRKARVTIYTNLLPQPYMRISFTVKDVNKTQIVYLTTTHCNYGGIRWWFNCPFCFKRVGKLFLFGENYACRHCHNLTYKSRMRNPRSSLHPMFNRYKRNEKARELMVGIRTTSYDGRPTKRYLKFLELTGEEYEY